MRRTAPRLVAAALLALAAPVTGRPQGAGRGAASVRTGGTVVTDTLWSQALGTNKALVVYLPPSYRRSPARRYPVAYYLHGATGDETNWTKLGRLAAVMDSLVARGMPEMIVAMPDGDAYSYYTTYNVLLTEAGCRQLMLPAGGSAAHDCVAWPHYDDYIAYDVVRYVDRRYRTLASGAHRGIAGLSMGGYGAITLALQYPGLFAAAASHSGVLWPMERAPFGRGQLPRAPADSATFAGIRAQTAAQFRVVFGADSVAWAARDPATLAARLRRAGKPLPALFADAGTADPYTAESRAFHDAMTSLGVRMTYHEWPGGHTWDYWRAHVGQSLAWLAGRIAPPPP
ncbi:MAG TPA: alpha/beta hydrolase family protein [Gemmatimonadaceae bacterium]|nr:alpha/beta hydrolase family protein [Gemmatimonadaceae bacterium]